MTQRMPQRRECPWAALITVIVGVLGVMVAMGRQGAPPRPAPSRLPVITMTLTSASPAPSPTNDAGPPSADRASCSIPDRGFGRYGPWKPLPHGRLLLPAVLPTQGYVLLLHFHGAEAVRRLLAPADLGLVIVALDEGEGSEPYRRAFQSPSALDELLLSVEVGTGKPRRLVLSSWSAGYGAVYEILRQRPGLSDAVLLLDSLYASYRPGSQDLVTDELGPFVALAQRATTGSPLFWLTHSEIQPPGYASTAETATHLIRALGGQREYASLRPTEGVEQKTRFARGGFRVLGFTGTTAEAHCAHLRMLLPLLRDEVLSALGPSASTAPTQ